MLLMLNNKKMCVCCKSTSSNSHRSIIVLYWSVSKHQIDIIIISVSRFFGAMQWGLKAYSLAASVTFCSHGVRDTSTLSAWSTVWPTFIL